MKDWNDALRAGVDILGAADQAWTSNEAKPNGKGEPSRLVMTRASDIKPEPVEWIGI